MITADEIRRKALSHWRSRRFFKAEMAGEPFFPLTIPFRKPAGRRLLEDFATVKRWLRELKQGSRAIKGFGYDIVFTTINHRQLGPQEVPERIVIADRHNFLRLIDKERPYQQFQDDLALVRDRQPQLMPFFSRQPGELLKYGGKWDRLLAICAYFRRHPRPGLYLRELEIRGVDTKFLERHKKIVSQLLDELLPDTAIDRNVSGLARHGFERRYYLKYDEPLIRCRLLDARLYPLAGLDDLSLPLSRFCRLDLPCERVFITENKINGLSFPACPGSLVIFGLGYGVRQLVNARWLRQKEIWYWGDLDTHGFAILARLRAILPQTRSFLMDRACLEEHKPLWGREEESQRCLDELSGLDGEEQALYNDLRADHYGANVRLEQERLPFALVRQRVADITGGRL